VFALNPTVQVVAARAAESELARNDLILAIARLRRDEIPLRIDSGDRFFVFQYEIGSLFPGALVWGHILMGSYPRYKRYDPIIIRKPDIRLLAAISFVLLLIAVIILLTKIMVIDSSITEILWDIFLIITIVIAMYCLTLKMDDTEPPNLEKLNKTE
jgi:L-asparagine transporter-like permease